MITMNLWFKLLKIQYKLLIYLAKLLGNYSYKIPFKKLHIVRNAYRVTRGNEEFYMNYLIPMILSYDRIDTMLYDWTTLEEIAKTMNLPDKLLPHLRYLLRSGVVSGVLEYKNGKYKIRKGVSVEITDYINFYAEQIKVHGHAMATVFSRLKLIESVIAAPKQSVSFFDVEFSKPIYAIMRDFALMNLNFASRRFEKVIDIGPGAGHSILFIDKWLNPREVYAIDNNEQVLKLAKQKLLHFNKINIDKVKFIKQDITSTQLSNEIPRNCDLAFLSYTLRYIPHEMHPIALKNIGNLLRKGGLAVIVDTIILNENVTVPLHVDLSKIPPYTNPPVYSYLKPYLKEAGFNDTILLLQGRVKGIYRLLLAMK